MRFTTEEEIDQLLAVFEAGTISKQAWTHKAHVAIAGAYIWNDPDSALPLLRFGILFLNRCHQTRNAVDSGYHETLTVFWFTIVKDYCQSRRASTRMNVINEMMETLPAGLFKEFYGFDVIRSHRARERWMAPDLKPLPGDDL